MRRSVSNLFSISASANFTAGELHVTVRSIGATMSVPLYQVDAFASKAFQGNPACVCLMEEQRPDEWLQSVAAEMNLSETAFVWRDRGHFRLRWFTPTTEVKLCGHATLAASHILWESKWLPSGQVAHFETLSGHLEAMQIADHIRLDFPASPPIETKPPPHLLDTLGLSATYFGSDGSFCLIEVETEEQVRQLRVDFLRLNQVVSEDVIVTAVSESGDQHFVSRCFAPMSGIDEDPVTGSAHCVLGPYWSERLGRTQLVGFQASDRGGFVNVEMQEQRVHLAGAAVTISRGELLV